MSTPYLQYYIHQEIKMTEEKKIRWISGFWKRIGALIIDTIFLGIIGQCLGIFFESFLVEIGVWGRLVGFAVALAYFGILNSNAGSGQTLGKKLLKIRVVNSNNELISPSKSIARYFILAIPFSLNGAPFTNDIMFSFTIYILSMIVFGGLLSIVYLYLFNRITRQSLHDLATGTFVVNVTADKQQIGKIWKPHLIIVGLFFIIASIAPTFTSSLAKQEPFVDLFRIRNSLIQNPSVKNATVSYGTSIFTSDNSEPSKTMYISALVYIAEDDTSNEELAHNLAESIVNNFPDALTKDTININLIYGFDIGIASRWNSHIHKFKPSQLVTSN